MLKQRKRKKIKFEFLDQVLEPGTQSAIWSRVRKAIKRRFSQKSAKDKDIEKVIKLIKIEWKRGRKCER